MVPARVAFFWFWRKSTWYLFFVSPLSRFQASWGNTKRWCKNTAALAQFVFSLGFLLCSRGFYMEPIYHRGRLLSKTDRPDHRPRLAKLLRFMVVSFFPFFVVHVILRTLWLSSLLMNLKHKLESWTSSLYSCVVALTTGYIAMENGGRGTKASRGELSWYHPMEKWHKMNNNWPEKQQ